MKKRTKEILSGVLVLSILMGSPSAMKAAAASGQERAGGRQMTAVRTELWQPQRRKKGRRGRDSRGKNSRGKNS